MIGEGDQSARPALSDRRAGAWPQLPDCGAGRGAPGPWCRPDRSDRRPGPRGRHPL